MKFQAIKGVRDILPAESALWNRVEQTAREVFATYGYGEIRLPIFEQTELFARSIGVDTDVVLKEMYTFEDHEAKDLEQFRRVFSRLIREAPPTDVSYVMNEFLEEIDLAYSQHEIPHTNEIEKQVRLLRDWRSGFSRLLDKHDVPEDGADNPPLSVKHERLSQRVKQDPQWQPQMVQLKFLLDGFSFGDVLTLRPEATASVCRAYIEHGMHTLPGNVKLYYIGPMFRRERPQKGRYRQFYQIGAEVLGQSDAPAIDAEVIEMLMAFFERVGLEGGRRSEVGGQKSEIRSQKSEVGSPTSDLRPPPSGVTLHINSIGCKECRPMYVAKLKEALIEHINELKADSQRRVETNPLRVLDSKLPEEQAVIEMLPRITEHLCAACREHYAEVKKQLALRGVFFHENWRLVRGLDYYMRTTFEITAPGLGAQNAVCGGGRYDGLVKLLGGQPTKGIGFAIGTDRLVLSLQEEEKAKSKSAGWKPAVQGLDIFVAWMGATAQPEAVKIARTLREAGFCVEVPAEEMKFKKSIGLADKLGARYALIIGENELKEGKYALKRLADGVQEKVEAEELIARVRRL